MLSHLGSPAFPSRVPLLLLWLLEDLIRPRDSAYPMRPNSLSPPLSAVLSGERHSTQASGWSHLCVASGPAHGRCSQSGSPTEGSFSLAPRGQPLSQLLTSLSSVRFGSSTHLPGWLGFPQSWCWGRVLHPGWRRSLSCRQTRTVTQTPLGQAARLGLYNLPLSAEVPVLPVPSAAHPPPTPSTWAKTTYSSLPPLHCGVPSPISFHAQRSSSLPSWFLQISN